MAANDVPCCETMFWVYLLISVALVAFAGLMSGLTLGLMSLSLVDLEVLTKAGQPQDRKNAGKILPIVKNQHLLLCTLLICNAMAMEALPIFLDALLPAWGAILISVSLILAFGEIIPQAVCSRYGLSVGAKLSAVVRLLVIVVFPIAYPIICEFQVLNTKQHGEEANLCLNEMGISVHIVTVVGLAPWKGAFCTFETGRTKDIGGHARERGAGKGGELTHDETTIISGALDLTQKTAKDAMTPLSEIFSLDLNSKLDEDTMSLIMSKGHSRIPVYSGSASNIIGLILVKNLIKCRAEDETPIRILTIRRIPRVGDSLPLYDILNQFQKGHSHMAAVVKSKHNVKDSAGNATDKNGMITININSNSSILQKQAEGKGIENKQQESIYTHAPPSVTSSDTTESQSPALQYITERCNDSWHPQPKKGGEQGDANITKEVLESLPDQEEEVIGIITMEDVLEELLQPEEILDETDEYVDVHNKKSQSRSPGAPSHRAWRTPMATPPSSGHQTPVSRKTYEKLRKPGDS
ncbi:unnamed protein product [Camellia sinensis]